MSPSGWSPVEDHISKIIRAAQTELNEFFFKGQEVEWEEKAKYDLGRLR